MVRLAVELGLHHDPRRQGSTFSTEECELRINLWWIVMIHDRGTSVLLGRPLAIAQKDFDTPPPTVSATVSEHFVDSKVLTDVQANIINSLYRPAPQSTEEFTDRARRILLSMTSFAKGLPPGYAPYFEGTQEWSEDQKTRLLGELTMDIGLTYLKYGIARLLLLRAMFTNKDIADWVKFKALDDGKC
jgi:Fungal specific transcription factor domain